MYALVSGISLYLESEHGFNEKFLSGVFIEIRYNLNDIIKIEQNRVGVGLKRSYL